MSDDFLTQERIQRLQLMGISVWQERGKRVPDVVKTYKEAVPTEHTGGPKPKAKKQATPTLQPSPDAPRPDVADFDWQQLRAAVSSCTACGLCESRTQTVFGVGDQAADVMVIGEAPGAEEDRRGEPFVGRAGGLLDSMLLSVGLNRQQVFIANVLKCRPPGNRDPHTGEARQCTAYLDRQIALVKPRVLIAIGRIAAQQLLESSASLARMRGKIHYYGESKVPLVVTYHPAYLLRSPDQKRKAWEDLLLSQQLLKEAVP